MSENSDTEADKGREEFRTGTHLAPLEHQLIGSSVDILGKNNKKLFVNLEALAENEEIRTNPNLLKPLGLINRKFSVKQIQDGREGRKTIKAYFPCFSIVTEIIMGEYAIEYKLAIPDENGNIPNNFEFKFKSKTGDYDSNNINDARVFDLVELSSGIPTYGQGEDKKSLFAIKKDRDNGNFSIVYMPLVP